MALHKKDTIVNGRRTSTRLRAISVAILSVLATGGLYSDVAVRGKAGQPTDGFPAALELSSLDGVNGFAISGIAVGSFPFGSVSDAGDINGDGIDDVIIGAPSADAEGRVGAGESYVVFGNSQGFAARIDVSSLTGGNGFSIRGAADGDNSGYSVSGLGDFNGDGIDDVIVSADQADPGGNSYAGASYVIFGDSSAFSPSIDLSALDGSNGFVVNGRNAYDFSGIAVGAAGDINADGYDDALIGAVFASPGGRSFAGESYVIFGTDAGFQASLDVSSLNGDNGLVINGFRTGDYSGASVSTAGDVNGDGIADLVIGAPSSVYGNFTSGDSYVLFGNSDGFAATLELSAITANNGFVINGVHVFDRSGWSVSAAGDVNGDGIDDVIVGAGGADPGGLNYAGGSYVVFGDSQGFSASLDLATLDGSNGFFVGGLGVDDRSGTSVSAAGDVNGDGIDDVVIGARLADPGGRTDAGESYVLFGNDSGFAASIDLSQLNGSNGFVINGVNEGDRSGFSVSVAGDINDDGVDDLIVSALAAGEAYVIFGIDTQRVFKDGFD